MNRPQYEALKEKARREQNAEQADVREKRPEEAEEAPTTERDLGSERKA